MKEINFENLEILSPAGNEESFLAAINNGADAVYLGLNSFNARMKADNFTTDNIRHYIALAHSFGVKVYITINTLLRDEDFDELINLVRVLTCAKADAFIVQDLGVAHVLKNCFKNIVLHASTQMGIHNLEGALVAKQLGFSRIVLSRETTLADIKEIHEKSGLEIEYFVQGALCVAFSGNCYLSSLENGASGNEGKCLQLCRLPYKNNQTNSEKYYLSPRDLSLLENLPKLIGAGVTSFKIEGRLKHPGYVGICTNLYKTALNLIKNNIFTNKKITEMNLILKKTFSRGDFNKNAYLVKNDENNIINSAFQNHIGIKVGDVESARPFKTDLHEIIINSTHPLAPGDGLKFIDKNGKQICSVGIGEAKSLGKNKYKIITKQKLTAGLFAFLIQDAGLEEKYLKNQRKIALKLNIFANKNENLKINFAFNNDTFKFISDEILQPANNLPISENDLINQFKKTGDTIFKIEEINIFTNGFFAPKSLLNSIRRNAFSALQNHIISANEKHITAAEIEGEFENQKVQKVDILSENMVICDDFYENFNKNVIQIIAPQNYQDQNFIKNLENITQKNAALFLPVITNFEDKKIINKIVNNLPKNVPLFANNIGGIYYKILENRPVFASPLLNIKNKFAILALNSLGIKTICASVEASSVFVKKYNLISFSEGLFPLMTFAHCPYKVVFENSCADCKYNDSLAYQNSFGKNYQVKRTKISHCYFYLMKPLSREQSKFSLKNLKGQI